MSYNGTVHCSWCGTRGHNKLGCPSRREAAKSNQWLKRELAREDATRKASVSNRTCSYCKQKGHNRRKCPVISRDRGIILKDTIRARKKLLESMQENGLGKGALVKTYHNNDFNYPILHLVESIDWRALDDAALYSDRAVATRSYARRPVKTRIANVDSTRGMDTRNGWYRAPTVGQVSHLSMFNLASILSGAIAVSAKGYYDRGSSETKTNINDTPHRATVECWTQTNPAKDMPKDWLSPLTLSQPQSMFWHFTVPDRGDEYDKRRLFTAWKERESETGEVIEELL